jgi:AcrR family transcriptional regulator
MPASQPPDARHRLLAAVVEHLARHGTQDLTLRGLAAAVGTSHRMLSYHFGSREGLLVAVAQEVERRQAVRLEALAAAPDVPPVEAIRRMWDELADSSMRHHERLFFDLYARALSAPDGPDGFLDHVVTPWLAPAAALFARLGFDPDEAAGEARLALAVARGLLLDLLATGDREATDRAMERYVARYAGRPQAGSGVD